MNRKKKKLGLLMILCILILCGCAGKQEEEELICVAIPDDIVSLDPIETKDVISENIARCLFSTLYTFDENMNLVPCLAQYSKRNSELEWTFQIKKNVMFHDGTPLTAEDVKFSIDRARGMEEPEKSLLVINEVTVVDPYTIQVTTNIPCVDLPSVFVRVSTSVMSKKDLESPHYDKEKPVGSGPFLLLARTKGEKISLQKYNNYFLESAQTKYLDFIIEPSEENRTAGLLNDRFDVVYRISSYDCDYLKLQEKVRIYENNSTKMEFLTLNPEYEPLNKILVRRAIAAAIDKQNIVNQVLDGYGIPLNSVIPQTIRGSKDFDGFAYNPELAKDLLKQAGYEDGFDITIITFDIQRKKMMEAMKLDLAKVGIRMNYESLELQDYLDRIQNGKHMATMMSWTSNPDPDSTFSQLYSKNGQITLNHSQFSDSRVETLILEGKQESNPDKQKELYEQASQYVAESYQIIPIYQPTVLVAASEKVTGVRVNSQGMFGYESLKKQRP